MKTLLTFSIFLTTLLLKACGKTPEPQHLAGADRDSHGCIGAAGYLWCEKENQCVRPWELAKDKGFENTEGDFNKHCNTVLK